MVAMEKRPGLTRTLPFGLYVGIMALDPVLQRLVPSGFDARWLYGIRVGVVLLALVILWRYFTELRDVRSVKWPDWGFGLILGVVVFVLWIHLDVQPLALAGGEGFDPRGGDAPFWGLVAARLAGAALIVPVMEELFWRSFILRWLQRPAFLSVDPSGVGFRALVISSALFATEHRLWFAGLLAGLAYGWLYKRSGSLWVPTLAHAVTNGLLGAYVLATGSWSFW
jgi:CAAX prenyl protease-like protein